MKSCFIILLFLLVCSFSKGQYIIDYDVARSKLGYKYIRAKDTVHVKFIKVYKSSSAFLHLSNFPSSFKDTIIDITSGFSDQTLDNPFGFLQAKFSNIFPSMGVESMPNEEVKKKIQEYAQLSSDSKKSDSKEFIASEVYEDFQIFNSHFYHVMSRLENSLLLTEKYGELFNQFSNIRYNTQLTKEDAKDSSAKLAESLVQGASYKPELFLLEAKRKNHQIQVLRDSLSGVMKIMSEIESNYNKASGQDEKIRMNINESIAIAREKLDKTKNIQVIKSDIDNTQEIAKNIYYAYTSIQQDNYFRKRQVGISRKMAGVMLVFTPIIDSGNTTYILNDRRAIKMDTGKVLIPILKKGPFRIRNSTGIGFSMFPESRKNFYIKSENGVNTILSERGDVFRPMLVNVLNFYMPTDVGFRWGGSIGLGVPFENGLNNINYLLGFTTFFGRNDPICLTVGLSGGKIKKLRDLKEGDIVNFTTLDEKRNFNEFYRIGYFLGITFNVSALRDNLW